MNAINSLQLDEKVDGYATDIHSIDSGSQNVLVYSTLFGSIYGWDLRSNCRTFHLKNDVRNDINSFCIDPKHNWLCLGTTDGDLITWDLRFRLAIATIDKNDSGEVPEMKKCVFFTGFVVF